MFEIDEEMSFYTSKIKDNVAEEEGSSAVLVNVNTNGQHENVNYIKNINVWMVTETSVVTETKITSINLKQLFGEHGILSEFIQIMYPKINDEI